MSAAAQLHTFDELYAAIEALPETLTGEILGPGELRTMSRPGGRHSFSSHRLGSALRGSNLIDGGTGWWIEVERELRLLDRLYVPDLIGWRVEEEPAFVDDNPITVTPGWVCEILSRRTQRGDRVWKLPTYAAAGVGYIWVIDPDVCTLEVYASRDALPVLVATAAGQGTVLLPPFADPIDVGSLWKSPR